MKTRQKSCTVEIRLKDGRVSRVPYSGQPATWNADDVLRLVRLVGPDAELDSITLATVCVSVRVTSPAGHGLAEILIPKATARDILRWFPDGPRPYVALWFPSTHNRALWAQANQAMAVGGAR